MHLTGPIGRPADPGSAGQLFALVRDGAASTRPELIEITGLSRSTVAARVDALLAAGLLRETSGRAAGRGRPALELSFEENYGHIVVAGLHPDRADLAVLDLHGRVLDHREYPVTIADGPDRVLSEVEDRVGTLLAEVGADPSDTVALGVGLPGPVDVELGRVIAPPVMPGWHDFPVRERLAARLGVPVLVENDANLMALGEQRTNWPDARTVLLVKVGTGIGAGIVIDGRLYRGVDGGAGDIGHIRMLGHDDPCACGSLGCLGAVASGTALIRRLAAAGKAIRHLEDLRALVQRGDPETVAALRHAGQLAGEVLTTVISVLNPDIVVVAGDVVDTANTQGHYLTGLREVVYQRSLPRATRNLRVVTGTLGRHASVVGTAALVVEEMFTPAAVDALLAARVRCAP